MDHGNKDFWSTASGGIVVIIGTAVVVIGGFVYLLAAQMH
ncbi:MAG: hypothetical protein RJA70_4689 [Pseudomonadota bacterium]|jgi:hypothetical protein